MTAASSALLTPGQTYQVMVFATPVGQEPDCIAWFTLTSLPSPGTGGLVLRSLLELDEALNLLGAISTQQQDMLPPTLEAATEALEDFTRRNALVLTSFDKLYRPGRTRKIYLDAWPVCGAPALTWGLDVGFTVFNSTAQIAYVTMTPASLTNQSIATVTLTSITGGVTVNSSFYIGEYPTIGAVAAAIGNAGNGWQVVTPNTQYSQHPASWLNYIPGQLGAVNQQVEFQLYNTQLWRYVLDPDRGIVELTQNLPEAYRYADRSFGIGFGWAWSGATEPRNSNVRVQYQAGYAVNQSDLNQGYPPVPSTLKAACLITARAIQEAAVLEGIVQSQSVSGRSYTLRSDASVVPYAARILLAKEMNNRFGGWGTR